MVPPLAQPQTGRRTRMPWRAQPLGTAAGRPPRPRPGTRSVQLGRRSGPDPLPGRSCGRKPSASFV